MWIGIGDEHMQEGLDVMSGLLVYNGVVADKERIIGVFMEVSKSDWKLFRNKIGEWQESYMARLNQEYIEILQRADNNPSHNFWDLEERIYQDKKKPGVCLELRKSNVYWDIARLIGDDVIKFDDLEDFSDELKLAVKTILSR
ncbi:hypothetical protein [Butyrivibrio fibrisolvens]|nr:hypothetical protein [Butyrivibrio fibrisolvens]